MSVPSDCVTGGHSNAAAAAAAEDEDDAGADEICGPFAGISGCWLTTEWLLGKRTAAKNRT